MGVGAALSVGMTGYAVERVGYSIGFLGLAAVALLGVSTLLWLFPEPKAGAARDWTRVIRMPALLRGGK